MDLAEYAEFITGKELFDYQKVLLKKIEAAQKKKGAPFVFMPRNATIKDVYLENMRILKKYPLNEEESKWQNS